MIDFNEKEKEVLKLREEGYSYGEITKLTKLCKSTVAYLAKKHLRQSQVKQEKTKHKEKTDYEEVVCSVIKTATSMSELCKLLGKRPTNNNYLALKKIIEKYNIDISHFSTISTPKTQSKKISDDEYFVLDNNVLKGSSKVKARLLKNNIKEHKCEYCGNTEWNSQPIPLELHHINGNRYDNRLENLQLLCPNCHAQTDTYAGKNINKPRKKYICQCCGKEFYYGEGSSKHSRQYCSKECRDKFSGMKNQYVKQDNTAHIIRPNAEQILEDYRIFGSFTKIGEKYNVSDNTIKKWFKKYKLPYKCQEIRSLIIEKYGKQPHWQSYLYDENGMRKNMSYKKIDVYDKNGQFFKTYNCAKDVLQDLNLNRIDSIRDVCAGRRSSYCGYVFKYHQD